MLSKSLALVSGPSVEPITLDEATRFCRVDDPSENPLIENLIAAAREQIELATGRAMISQQWLLTLPDWATGYRDEDRSALVLPFASSVQASNSLFGLYSNVRRNDWRTIPLERSPLISIDSVQYYDTKETLQTLTAWNSISNPTGIYYPALTNPEPGLLALRPDAYWPDTYIRPDAIQIKFTAGFGTTADKIPQNLRHAILLLTKHLYDNRDVIIVGTGSAIEIPHGIKSILESRKVGGWIS